jgi:hypothetical protein
VRAAGGFFPLGFGGQTLTGPGTVRFGIVPAQLGRFLRRVPHPHYPPHRHCHPGCPAAQAPLSCSFRKGGILLSEQIVVP